MRVAPRTAVASCASKRQIAVRMCHACRAVAPCLLPFALLRTRDLHR